MEFCARILLSCFIEVYGNVPPQFDYEPVKYQVKYLDAYDLKVKAHGFSAWEYTSVGSGTIFVDEALKGLPEGEIMIRHGKGHVNGWRH